MSSVLTPSSAGNSHRPMLVEDKDSTGTDCLQYRNHMLQWVSRISKCSDQRMTCVNCISTVIRIDSRGHILRPLKRSERQVLAGDCRCTFSPGSNVSILFLSTKGNEEDSDYSNMLQERVSASHFHGNVVLVCSSSAEATAAEQHHHTLHGRHRPGVHSNDWISNSILDLTASLCHNRCLEDCYIGPHALVHHSHVAGDKQDGRAPFYACLSVTVGAESGGGRNLRLSSNSDMMEVCQQLKGHRNGERGVADSVDHSHLSLICRESQVLDSSIDGCVLFPKSLSKTSTITRGVLYPHTVVQNAVARNVFLQWNASITDYSVVSDALLCEQAHAGPHSVCSNSVLGPDVHVSCGEVHASVIGPNTNAHHQSLVIGVLWPLGRGNVGYGANVGSNHTGRIPDQETVAGEGTFWGLSTVIKFPVNLAEAPYSVIAAGTSMGPQRVRMPFSLIVEGNGRSAKNSILPGWLLKSSPYTLARSEQKFATRRKARRHKYTGWKILRPETINLCVTARQALIDASRKRAPVYRGKDIPELGDNELSEKGRVSGIEAYTDCIQRYALQGLLSYLENLPSWSRKNLQHELQTAAESEHIPTRNPSKGNPKWGAFPWEVDSSFEWEYQLSLLRHEFPIYHKRSILVWISDLLQKLVILEDRYAQQIRSSKARDDVRGEQTIPGYKDCHVAAENDPVVVRALGLAQDTQNKVAALLHKLKADENGSMMSSRL